MMAEGVFDTLEDVYLQKTCTIRKGRRNILLGELTFESIETHRICKVNVIRVIYCALHHVSNEYIHNDGFEDHRDMLNQMRNFYPDIEFNSEVTIVEFYK